MNKEPVGARERVAKIVWRAAYAIFPSLQKILLKLHIIWHENGRQRYHIGWLRRGATLEELKKHLSEKWHFGNHFVAWKDDDQVLSWRRLESFEKQWHLRVYADGEIRGHYENTPEANPLQHMREDGEIDRTEEFRTFLGTYCVRHRSFVRLTPDRTMTDPVSEITVDDPSV
ncbi:hypothetical protein HKL94_02430 [Candidatus Parcubacteria bacterium]|nr:hypothetical protein [Candidatus Parcubacteria bacterium]